MISIMELAKELHVSRQALYNKLQKAGIAIDDVTQETQGKKRLLSDEGATRIRNLFASKDNLQLQQLQQKQLQLLQLQQLQTTVTQLQQQIKAMEIQRMHDKQLLQSKDKTIETLEKTMNAQQLTIEGLTNTVQAQSIAAATQAKTIQDLQAKSKTGLFARIGNRIALGKAKGK